MSLRLTFTFLLLAGCLSGLRADWLDDIGYNKLAAELGAAMPTGAGITLIQSEANDIASPPNYLPQAGGPGSFAGTGIYADKTFFAQSGAGTELGHAQSVSSFYYIGYSGVARGATQIHLYTATDFLDRLTAGSAPEVLPGRVQNHSWAGSYGSSAADQDALRNMDLMIHRDGSIVAVPLFNGAAMQGLLGNNYHAITAGLRSGNHSLGGTNTDGSGRMKPDLVVNVDLTSFASPAVAGSAALLLQEAIASGNTNSEKPQTIKAILLAAASKKPFPQWQRDTTAEPYDDVFGAGELSLHNAWHIQHAGEHAFSTSAEVPSRGWDFAVSTNASGGRRYFFTIPAGQVASTFSVALTWHRIVTGLFSLPNLNLKLYAASRAYAPKPWKMCWVAAVLKAGSREQRLRLLRMEPLTELVLSTLVDSSRSSVRLCAADLSRTWQWSSW